MFVRKLVSLYIVTQLYYTYCNVIIIWMPCGVASFLRDTYNAFKLNLLPQINICVHNFTQWRLNDSLCYSIVGSTLHQKILELETKHVLH